MLNSFESPPKRRKTIVDLEKEFHVRDGVILELQSSVSFLNMQVANLNTTTLNLRRDLTKATDRVKELDITELLS